LGGSKYAQITLESHTQQIFPRKAYGLCSCVESAVKPALPLGKMLGVPFGFKWKDIFLSGDRPFMVPTWVKRTKLFHHRVNKPCNFPQPGAARFWEGFFPWVCTKLPSHFIKCNHFQAPYFLLSSKIQRVPLLYIGFYLSLLLLYPKQNPLVLFVSGCFLRGT